MNKKSTFETRSIPERCSTQPRIVLSIIRHDGSPILTIEEAGQRPDTDGRVVNPVRSSAREPRSLSALSIDAICSDLKSRKSRGDFAYDD